MIMRVKENGTFAVTAVFHLYVQVVVNFRTFEHNVFQVVDQKLISKAHR